MRRHGVASDRWPLASERDVGHMKVKSKVKSGAGPGEGGLWDLR